MADELKPVLDAIAELKRHTDVRFDELKRHTDVRFDEVHDRIDQSLEATALLAAKVDRQGVELREEMRVGFDEVKAAVRFSYAELDRRLTSTEHDVADLRSRVERLEAGPSDTISDR